MHMNTHTHTRALMILLLISATCCEADLEHLGHGNKYTSTYCIPAALALVMVAGAFLSGSPTEVSCENYFQCLAIRRAKLGSNRCFGRLE